MRIYWALVATSVVALLGDVATAGVVSQRFNIDSKMMLNNTTLLSIGTNAPDFTPIVANVGSATYGSTLSTLDSSDTLLRIASTMAPAAAFRGSSSGNGRYDLLAGTNVSVTWDWAHTTDSGGWRVVRNSDDSVVASLTFSQGQFTATGGSFSTTASGNAIVGLSADGTYRFEAFYFGRNNPTSSVVEFSFVPAPGALALVLAAAGRGRSRRR
jgi:hypothetical protein